MTKNHSCHTMPDLLNILGTKKQNLKTAINLGYKRYKKYKNGKFRWIDKPNDELKFLQKQFNQYLQKYLPCPTYCMAGFKGQNNIKNAEKHIGKREVITMDISHCFPNTKAKYIRKFFAETLGASGEVLDILVKLATYNTYLPTGASTSSLLLAFAHKEVFDNIYKKMQELDIDMTVYIDDITLSSHKHIGNWVIKYVNNNLKTHGLWLKKSKIKRYSYKFAEVTGVHIAQSGKLSAQFKIGHSAIKDLQQKNITEMNLKELRGLVAKISYLQQFKPNTMKITKQKAIKQLKKLQEQNPEK
jgi:hypothetical protein